MAYRSIYWFAGLNLAIAAAIVYGVQRSSPAEGSLGPVPASSDWVKVSENDSFVFYMEPAPAERDGSMRRVWELFDLKQRSAHEGEASMRSLNEYDCKAERYRILAASGHSGPMATGEVLWNRGNAGEWAVPGEDLFKLVCSRRDAQWVRLEHREFARAA